MTHHLEIEFKNLLTKQEFEKIKNHFSLTSKDFILQENTYLDTEQFSLKERGCALRIRAKNGTYEMTLKEPENIGLLETNQKLSKQEVDDLFHQGIFPQGVITDKLQKQNINVNQLKPFGTLKTWRAEKFYKNGLLVLDHSVYLNKEDFELEYEVDDPVTGEKHFRELLKLLQIEQRKTENKIVRFYQEKMQLEEENNEERKRFE